MNPLQISHFTLQIGRVVWNLRQGPQDGHLRKWGRQDGLPVGSILFTKDNLMPFIYCKIYKKDKGIFFFFFLTIKNCISFVTEKAPRAQGGAFRGGSHPCHLLDTSHLVSMPASLRSWSKLMELGLRAWLGTVNNAFELMWAEMGAPCPAGGSGDKGILRTGVLASP